MKRYCLLTLSVLALAACSKGAPAAAAEPPLPRGASFGPEGFATILEASPAPFTPVRPGEPQPPTAEQLAEQAHFSRIGAFQNRVMNEVQALSSKLRTAEKGNFVDLYFENEGEPSVVFRFLRNPQATLGRYTRNPRFFAEQARFSKEELRAALVFMMKTFREDRVIQGGGTGNKSNRAVIDLAVTEAEFRALVARKGATIPEAVELRFIRSDAASISNRPLAPEIARLVRILPRDDRPTGIVNAINSRAKIVLRDGCFRLADHDDALVLFPLGASLFVDSEGYLAFGSADTPEYARVGETVVFPGSLGEVTVPALVDPIRAACGDGKVVKVTAMQSAAAQSAQQALTDEVNALRRLREEYGLSEDQAHRALAFLARRQATQTQHGSSAAPVPPIPPAMIVNAPPRPAASPGDCPSGTSLSFGLCRTREGYLRPLPQWLAEFMQGEP